MSLEEIQEQLIEKIKEDQTSVVDLEHIFK